MIIFIQLVIAILELVRVVVEKVDKIRIRAIEMKEQAIQKKAKRKLA